MQFADGLTKVRLERLIDHVYAKVRADALLGPLFNKAIGNWPEHLRKLTDFWSSVMLATGRYKGQPIPAHMRHRAKMSPAMFQRWLTLWEGSAARRLPADAAETVTAKAHSIAASLQMALFEHLPPARASH